MAAKFKENNSENCSNKNRFETAMRGKKEFLSWMTVSNTVRAAEQDKQSRLYLENCILKKHRIAENTRNEVFCNDSYEV